MSIHIERLFAPSGTVYLVLTKRRRTILRKIPSTLKGCRNILIVSKHVHTYTILVIQRILISPTVDCLYNVAAINNQDKPLWLGRVPMETILELLG
jgi:hypothetical protein